MQSTAWKLYAHAVFEQQLRALVADVERVKESHPDTFGSHPSAELLVCVRDAYQMYVPRDPFSADFFLGTTLKDAGKKIDPKYRACMSHWRRVKKRLPPRRRLFFWVVSEQKRIVYAWLNDKNAIRENGGKNDVYLTFCRLLRAGTIPNDYAGLCKASKEIAA